MQSKMNNVVLIGFNMLHSFKKTCIKIKNCVKITGFVNSSDDFIDQPKVLNSASELLATLFGDNGKHARVAVSSNSLPLGIAVEIDAIFEKSMEIDNHL